MRLGLRLEGPIISKYVHDNYSASRSDLSYPGLLQHESIKFLRFSPDAILTAAGTRILIEVKTSRLPGKLKPRSFKHQIQMGLLVSGCAHAVLLAVCTSMINESRMTAELLQRAEIKSHKINIDLEWRRKFQSSVISKADTFLGWYHSEPADRVTGRNAIEHLLGNHPERVKLLKKYNPDSKTR